MKIFAPSRLFDARERNKGLSPVQLVALYFAAAIVLGGLLLALPISHRSGVSLGLLDALFTATSAICVTGLVVVDTGSSFSGFGQAVLLLLIQSGGLGIVTLGTLIAFASGRRVSFRERMNLQAQLNTFQVGGVLKLIQRIVLLTLLIELIGMLLLSLSFFRHYEPLSALYYALFHSISAFNNAGFGLLPDSLMQYVADPIINFTIMALIILGGLGFIVEMNLLGHWQRKRDLPLSLHTKVVLFATAVLIVSGTILFWLLERNNPKTLGALGLPSQWLASLFQSVTPRTAGFNTLDYGSMDESTLLFTMLLMFIGASPGSTGGGIKTVTFFILVGSAWTISRGRGELVLFGRRLALDMVVKAGVIALISIMLVGAAITALTVTDPDKAFLRLAFEAVSAFGTVGLSTGITADMSVPGKIILMLLMYLGRIGPLTFAVALVASKADRKLHYPAEEVIIG
jgi:trk system potassium uptake protein